MMDHHHILTTLLNKKRFPTLTLPHSCPEYNERITSFFLEINVIHVYTCMHMVQCGLELIACRTFKPSPNYYVNRTEGRVLIRSNDVTVTRWDRMTNGAAGVRKPADSQDSGVSSVHLPESQVVSDALFVV